MEFFSTAKSIALDAGDSATAVLADRELASLQHRENEQENAEKMLLGNIRTLQQTGNKKEEVSLYKALADLYAKTGDAEKSLQYKDLYYQGKDSLVSKEVQFEIGRLEEQYKSEKKEAEIALLKKDQQIIQSDLERQKDNFYAVSAVAFLVLLMAILLVNRYKVIHRAKRQVEMEKMRNTLCNDAVRGRLKQIYEREENYPALARILIGEAGTIDDSGARFIMLRQAGELLIDEDPAAAADALRQSLALRPTDQTVILLLVDACNAAGHPDQASAVLDGAIEAMRGRRSPELCILQHRKAAAAAAAGDQAQQLHWLKEAHNTDRNNGDVAVELADLAEQLEDYDLAIRVLRSIALMEAAPLSRAIAYLRQGYIAERRGDRQKAVLWSRKALMEDPNCAEATDFLRQLGEL